MVPTSQKVKTRSRKVHLLLLLTLLFALGCFHEFYRVNRADLEDFKNMVEIGTIQKFYIIHYRDVARKMSNIAIVEGNLQGVLDTLPPGKYHYLRTDPLHANRYKPTEKDVLHEVHVFLQDTLPFRLYPGPFSAPVSAIREIQVYDKHNGATVASHVAGFTGLGVGVALLVDALTPPKESPPPQNTGTYDDTSCPYVYAHNGETYRLQGEIFGGAIFPNLERHDYLPLPDIEVVDGSYQVMISNELKEIQHINLARLAIVEHPAGSQVLLDQSGNPHTLTALQPPDAAGSANGKDILPLLAEKDLKPYFFEDGEVLYNHVEMDFEKPKNAAAGKLVLAAKNSFWLDFMFGQFTKKQGAYYHHWVAEQRKRPASELMQWVDEQGMRLGVYLQQAGKWELVTRIHNIGPLAFRDIVVPVDLQEHTGRTVKIKLEGGQLFWDLDYAAMDFSKNLPVKHLERAPRLAKASDNQLYTQALAQDDKSYLDQKVTGHRVSLWYDPVPARPGFEQSLFLHSKGYYEHIRAYSGLPDLLELPKFDRPGYFIEFSKERFLVYLETNNLMP